MLYDSVGFIAVTSGNVESRDWRAAQLYNYVITLNDYTWHKAVITIYYLL